MKNKTCILIGGGATAILVAIELLKRAPPCLQLIILEPDVSLGRGMAYRESTEGDLLNVSAEEMSADVENPHDFVECLQARHDLKDFPDWPLVTRTLYGEYLQSKISSALPSRVRHVQAKATSLTRSKHRYLVTLASDQANLTTDFVVICTGYGVQDKKNFLPLPPQTQKTEPLIVIGSGLSAIDIWRRKRNRHQIVFLSRHGLLPLPELEHSQTLRLPSFCGMSPRQILRLLRTLQALGNLFWQDLADALRPQCTAIWSCWTASERKQFHRHLKTYWEIMRHRISRKIYLELQSDLSSGQLQLLAGHFISATLNSVGAYTVNYQERGGGNIQNKLFQDVQDAKGVTIDQHLFKKTKVLAGLEICPDGFGYRNHAAPRVWVAGPAAKATRWEITSIAEIREQAAEISRAILASLHSPNRLFFDKFLIHPKQVAETYLQHFFVAMRIALTLCTCTIKITVHAVFPFLFTDSVSKQLRALNAKLVRRTEKSCKPDLEIKQARSEDRA